MPVNPLTGGRTTGIVMSQPQSWQWQPDEYTHDPNPPLPLEEPRLNFISTEFADGPALPSQAWFDQVRATGWDGILLAVQDGAAPYANIEQWISRADAAGLLVGVYARPLTVLLTAYNTLSQTAKNIIRVLIMDVEIEPLNATGDDTALVMAASAAGTYNTGITSPTTPRSITATPVGTAANVLAADIVITGTDPDGAAQTNTLTLTAGSLATIDENYRIFSTVTQVVINNPGVGVTVKIGLGGGYGITHTMVSDVKATGKTVVIYASWGGWQDIMGDYPDHGYGSFAYLTPWSAESLFMRDLYTVAGTDIGDSPIDVYTPAPGKVWESWPSKKPVDWTTRQAVQWADPITQSVGSGDDSPGNESYAVTANQFDPQLWEPTPIILLPDPVAVPLVTPAPSITKTYALAPTPVAVPIATPAPTITRTTPITLSPVAVAVTLALPAPTIGRTYALAPSPVAIPLALPAPTVTLGALNLAPAPVSVTLALPAPTVSSALALSPVPVTVPLLLPAPTISQAGGGIALAPDPVAVILLVPAPTISGGSPAPVPVVVVGGGGGGYLTERYRQPTERQFERELDLQRRRQFITPAALVVDLAMERQLYYDREAEELIALVLL